MTKPTVQVVRHADLADLAVRTAKRLLASLVELQADGRITQLSLAGGRTAMATYAEFSKLVPGSELDTSRLELWWSDERFLPTEDPQRNAGPALALFASSFAVDPARTHSMPSADGTIDAAASAATYAKELGDTVFDLCLVGMGPHGSIGSIFSSHPSHEPTNQPVIGVSDAPLDPPERISLTIDRINTSTEIWVLAGGAEKAEAVGRALAGDSELPAAQVAARGRTLWLVDEPAATQLPYFECSV
jgi:6-phosphogluconolactonase